MTKSSSSIAYLVLSISSLESWLDSCLALLLITRSSVTFNDLFIDDEDEVQKCRPLTLLSFPIFLKDEEESENPVLDLGFRGFIDFCAEQCGAVVELEECSRINAFASSGDPNFLYRAFGNPETFSLHSSLKN